MQPTSPFQFRASQPSFGGMPQGKKFLGWWGAFGGEKQKITTYTLSSNAQSPMKGAIQQYVYFGIKRIALNSIYFGPPMAAGYALFTWANGRYAYLCSKEGHHETMLKEAAEEAAALAAKK